MPAGDRTGPSGQGPGTGRAFGYCYGNNAPGFSGGQGRRMGGGAARGFQSGRGFFRNRSRFSAYPENLQEEYRNENPGMEDEGRLLRSRLDILKRSQAEIEKRLGELEK
ncbi:MAG: DUF5320 domain-containing protein [Bacteroidales bacterium]|nr:DUF5320 domain-containing protein [Bacteroidales bacterium]